MTYEQAQTIKDDAGINDEIAQSLRRLDTETHDPLNVINKELRLADYFLKELKFFVF
jgi:hypothetical protein